MKNEQMVIGQIVNTHGVRGAVKVVPFTDDMTRFEDLEWVYVKKENQDQLEKYNISRVQYHRNKFVLIRFKDVFTVEDAEKFKNALIIIDRDMAIELPEDTYFICDLIGLKVNTLDGRTLGNIVDVISTGANDVYVVKDASEKEILLPAIKDVVKVIDIENNFMLVELLEGLIDE